MLKSREKPRMYALPRPERQKDGNPIRAIVCQVSAGPHATFHEGRGLSFRAGFRVRHAPCTRSTSGEDTKSLVSVVS